MLGGGGTVVLAQWGSEWGMGDEKAYISTELKIKNEYKIVN